MPDNVLLVGPMGAGKSTIGRMLASKLGYKFLDTDTIIEERTGADIPWIFDVEGEAGFRDREANVLADIAETEQAVIATGGGIVIRDENRAILKKVGKVIYLAASVEQLVQRTYKDKKRPLLQTADPQKKITELFKQRDPLYREVADYIVVTDNCAAKNVVQKIVNLLST